jgi:hypothetical protein
MVCRNRLSTKARYRILKVERIGSGMKTKYHFTPVVDATTATATS